MQIAIVDHQLRIDDVAIDIPRLATAALVHAWSVPTTYRDNGYFVAVQAAGQPLEIPACDGRDAQYLGQISLEADAEAVLAGEKAAACGRLNAKRDALQYSVYTDSNGHPYDVDARGREKMTGLEAKIANGLVLPDGFTWTGADNVERAHTNASFLALTTEILLWTSAVHGVCVAAKAAIRDEAVTTLEAVAAIEAGVVWP